MAAGRTGREGCACALSHGGKTHTHASGAGCLEAPCPLLPLHVLFRSVPLCSVWQLPLAPAGPFRERALPAAPGGITSLEVRASPVPGTPSRPRGEAGSCPALESRSRFSPGGETPARLPGGAGAASPGAPDDARTPQPPARPPSRRGTTAHWGRGGRGRPHGPLWHPIGWRDRASFFHWLRPPPGSGGVGRCQSPLPPSPLSLLTGQRVRKAAAELPGEGGECGWPLLPQSQLFLRGAGAFLCAAGRLAAAG